LISTQSLSFEDIHNHLDTDAKSQQASLNLDNGKAQLPLMQSDSVSGSHKTSTTQSAIAQGQIEVRDDQQTGNNSLAGLSRDTDNASGALTDTFNLAEIQEKQQQTQLAQEVAQSFSQEAMTAVGNHFQKQADKLALELKLEQDKDPANMDQSRIDQLTAQIKAVEQNRTLAHGAVGGLTAIATHGNIAQGAAGAVAGHIVSDQVADAVAERVQKGEISKEVGTLLTNLSATAAGAAVGGTEGAFAANQGDRYNRQLHRAEMEILEEARDKLDELGLTEAQRAQAEQEMNALACAKIQCAAGVPEDDKYYAQLQALQQEGEALESQGQDLNQRLDSLGVDSHITVEVGRGRFPQAQEQFQHTAGDKIKDTATALGLREGIDRGANAIQGLIETAGAVAGGVSTAALGADCVAGSKLGCAGVVPMAGLTTLSADAVVESIGTAFTDQESDEGERVLNSFNRETYQEDTLVKDAAKELAIVGAEVAIGKVAGPAVKELTDKLQDRLGGDRVDVAAKGAEDILPKANSSWSTNIPDHPLGYSNSQFGKKIADWGNKPEGTLKRLEQPVTSSDITRAKEAGYTKEHFIAWRDRYSEVAAATTDKTVKTPIYRAELMQRFIDAWEK